MSKIAESPAPTSAPMIHDAPPPQASAPSSTSTPTPSTDAVETAPPGFDAWGLDIPVGKDGSLTQDAVDAGAGFEINNLTTRTGVFDRVNADEREAIHSSLEAMSPEAFEAQIDTMEASGALDRYVRGMDADERADFVAQLEHNGVVSYRAGRQFDRPLNPPDMPVYVDLDRAPRGTIGEVVSEFNVDLATAYNEEYSSYILRYEDAASEASTEQEIYALGRPSEYQQPWGSEHHDALERRTENRMQYHGPGRDDAYMAVGRRIRDLRGEPRPGSFRAEARVDLQVGRETFEVAVNQGDRDDSPVEAEFTVGGIETQVTEAGTISVSQDVLDVGVASVGSHGSVNAREGTMSQGVHGSADIGAVSVDASLDVVFNGVKPPNLATNPPYVEYD